MSKFKNREPEFCAYRNCRNEFRPKRELQRFCSPRCRDAYHYDLKLLKQGGRERLEARKRHLGPGTPRSAENGAERSTKTIGYGPYFVVKGFGIEVPSTTDIDPELLRYIVRIERGEPPARH